MYLSLDNKIYSAEKHLVCFFKIITGHGYWKKRFSAARHKLHTWKVYT